jgi:putative chitinase
MITTDILVAAGVSEPRAILFAPSLDDTCTKFQINTPLRIAAFIAQVAYESADMSTLSENLNYSAKALLTLFPHHFDEATAIQYARKPEKIANRIYANRYGNGDESSGDGWKYRGRGLIQLTFKDNYRAYSTDIYNDDRILVNPDLVAQVKDACLSSGWFWIKHGLNALADKENFSLITERINGGKTGESARMAKYIAIRKHLGLG